MGWTRPALSGTRGSSRGARRTWTASARIPSTIPTPASGKFGDILKFKFINTCISRSFTSAGQSVFCQFEDDESFEEYYDLDSDPWQLTNLALSLEEDQLIEERNILADLGKCQGQECQKYNIDISGALGLNLNFILIIILSIFNQFINQ